MKYRIIEAALGFQPQVNVDGKWENIGPPNSFLTVSAAKDYIDQCKQAHTSKEAKVVWEDDKAD